MLSPRFGTWLTRVTMAAGAVAALTLLALATPWLLSGLPAGASAALLRIGMAALLGLAVMAYLSFWWRRRRAWASGLASSTRVIDRTLASLLQPQSGPVRDLRRLPWALVVGAPAAGHPAVLSFTGASAPVGEVASPLHWRLTAHGVLLDIAGEVADRSAVVRHLCQALKRERPLQPVNAVVLALSASDLLLASAEGKANVATLVDGLRQLQAGLGVQPPLRLLVTRCQRVDGFPGAAAQQRLRRAAAEAGLPHAPEDCLLDADTSPDVAARRDFFGERLYAGARDCIDAAWLRRRRRLVAAGYAAIAVALMGVAFMWAESYLNNLGLIHTLEGRLPRLRALLADVPPPTDADPRPLVPALEVLRQAAQLAERRPPPTSAFGLYQGERLGAAGQQAYQRLLHEGLGPRIALGLEERLAERLAEAEPTQWMYETLRRYLMLYVPDRFDPEALRAWTTIDWQTRYGSSADPETIRALAVHRDALLARGPMSPSRPMDTALVERAREVLTRMPRAEITYQTIMAAVAGGGGGREFTVAEAAGAEGVRVFRRLSGSPLTRGVPEVFTAAAYGRFERKVLTSATAAQSEAAWVLGQNLAAAGPAAGGTPDTLLSELLDQYVGDYVSAWDAFLSDVRLNVPADPVQRAALARMLAAPRSPLWAWLQAVVHEFRELGATPALPALPRPAAFGQISARYAPLLRLFDGGSPVLGTLRGALDDYANEGASTAAARQLQAVVATLPDPLRSMLEDLTGRGRAAANADLAALADMCRRVIDGRYPFVPGAAAEVALADFARLFGPGGAFDTVFNDHLAAQVDTSAPRWTGRPGLAIPATALDSFQSAARLRDLFFAKGGSMPGLKANIRVMGIDVLALRFLKPVGEVGARLTLKIGAQPVTLTPRNTPVSLSWPGQAAGLTLEVHLGRTPIAAVAFPGHWAPFRWLDSLALKPASSAGRYVAEMRLDNRAQVNLELNLPVEASSVTDSLRRFRCPEAAPAPR